MSELRELHSVKACFDTSTTDSAGVSNKTQAAHGLGVYIPKNAVVTKGIVDVVTGFADGVSDLATIALKIASTGDLVAATTVADATNVWDAGIHGTLIGSPILGSDATTADACTAILYAARISASMVKTTALCEVTATVGAVTLTAGKLYVYIEYFISS